MTARLGKVRPAKNDAREYPPARSTRGLSVGVAQRRPQALWPVLASVAIEARPAHPEVLLVAQPLVQHAQPYRADPLVEMLVVRGDGQARVADAWTGSHLRDRCASRTLPAH